MAPNQFLAVTAGDDSVSMVLGLHFQHHAFAKIIQAHPPFDLGLRNVPIHLVTEVGMGREQLSNEGRSLGFPGRNPLPDLRFDSNSARTVV